jgi:hypothetical protein
MAYRSKERPATHDGMTDRQRSTAGSGGLGHGTATAPDASGPTAADPTIAGKAFVGKVAPTVQGHRSRTQPGLDLQAHSDKVLGESFARGADLQDRMAHNRMLPEDLAACDAEPVRKPGQ